MSGFAIEDNLHYLNWKLDHYQFLLDVSSQQEEGNFTMEKKYTWNSANNLTHFATEAEALEKAKRWVGNRNGDGVGVVYQAIAKVEAPMPEAIVTKL